MVDNNQKIDYLDNLINLKTRLKERRKGKADAEKLCHDTPSKDQSINHGKMLDDNIKTSSLYNILLGMFLQP